MYQGRDHSTKHLAAICQMTGFGMLVHDCITHIAKEEDLMILLLAQNKKEFQLFHQPTTLGSLLDDPVDHYVALLGMGPTANPVEIDATLVQDIEILMLTWIALEGAEGNEEVFKQLQVPKELHAAKKLKGKNLLANPIILAEVFIDSPRKDPTSITLMFLKIMFDFDMTHREEEEKEKFSKTFMHAIQFCWAAANSLLTSVSYCISESIYTTKWADFVHHNAIMAHANLQVEDMSDKQEQMKQTLEAVKYDLAYVKGQSEGKTFSSAKEESKRGFKKLPKPVQSMVLKASSTDAKKALAIPTEMYSKFLEQKNAGDAKGYLQYQLESIKVSNFVPCMLLVSALHKGFFFWDRKDLPSNFSIFLCSKPTPISSTASETITFAMKSENGNGLTDSEIAKTL